MDEQGEAQSLRMEEGDDSNKLDLNMAVSNENDEETKGVAEQDYAQKPDDIEEFRVSSEDAGKGIPDSVNDEVMESVDKKPDSDDIADNGIHVKHPSPVRNGSRSRSPSPVQHKAMKSPPVESDDNNASPLTKRTPSLSPKTNSSPVPPEKRSSPSPKRKRSSPPAGQSSSRSPEGRHGRRSTSKSPEGRHGRRRDDGRRLQDRSRSPARRSSHRERSRSRSPHDRERDRYRSRYSPHRRSSPARHSYRGDRSPRKRPWSPPRNRNTGLGKPGNHLFVAGFSFSTTERDLEKKFGRYGRVTDVRIIRDRRSGDSRGFGFLSLERDEDADAAIKGLDQTEWNGRIVLVEKAKTN